MMIEERRAGAAPCNIRRCDRPAEKQKAEKQKAEKEKAPDMLRGFLIFQAGAGPASRFDQKR